MGKDEKKPLGQTIRENASAFGTFIYNSEEGTVLGRNSSSWGRISVFYLFYYAFLAALFAISITITYSLMPTDKPYYQTRLQTPGVTIQPKLPSKVASNTDIIYSIKKEGYLKYTDHLATFLAGYNMSGFGACTDYEKAYKNGQPCVFVKINKIINWTPIPFDTVEQEGEDKYQQRSKDFSKAPPLSDWLQQQGLTYQKYPYVYVSCYGVDSKKTEVDDKTAVGNFTLFQNKGILLSEFPYTGIKATNTESDSDNPDPKDDSEVTYQCPIMAIQFNSPMRNKDIKVGCKAYAKNILDEERINAGYIHFTMKICDTDDGICVKA